MDLELNGKTAIVTGGSRGIGKAVVRELALEGVDVAIVARGQEMLESTAEKIQDETGRKIIPIQADTGVGNVVASRQHQGKAMSYNNIADADAALECAKVLPEIACVIVKHANPCGVGIAGNTLDAYEKAYKTDPTSAFGGIIALNVECDGKLASTIVERQFLEVIVAPSYAPDALAAFAAKPNIRVLETGPLQAGTEGRIRWTETTKPSARAQAT